MILFKRINRQRLWCFIQARLASLITVVIFVACHGGTAGEGSMSSGPDNALNPRAAARFMLTVNPYGEGMGSVSSNGGGIDCGASCSGTFEQGSTVVLIATPGENSSFGGWSGGGCSGTETCQVTLDEAVTVRAYFTVAQGFSDSEERDSPLTLGSLAISKEGLPGIN